MLCTLSVYAQQDSSSLFDKRQILTVTSATTLYAGTSTALYFAWYKNYATSSFHFFNDDGEWLQMDKLGHSYSSFVVGKLGFKTLQWCGYNKRKSILIGGAAGLLFLSTIELMDGYSSGWGFSWGDMGANVIGYSLLAGQYLIYKDFPINIKLSYLPSIYAQYRPNLLGGNFVERMLKDYNAQTYWLSINLRGVTKEQLKAPSWLNIAFGYGANGMIGGHYNPTVDANGNVLPQFTRYRQYYLSIDIDWSKIPTKKVWVHKVLSTFNVIKFPFPALELSQGRLYGHRIGF